MSIATSLPPEILQHALSYLIEEIYPGRNRTSLCSCSLVCRAWRDVAQGVLFRNISLYLDRLPWTDPNMKDFGVVAPFFHRLNISSYSFSNDLKPSKGEASSDTDNRLTFEPVYGFHVEVPEDEVVRWDRAITIFRNITVVHLSDVYFNNFVALRDVLAGFPALERLSMDVVSMRMPCADDVPTWTGLRLRSLVVSHSGVDDSIISALLTWLATAENPRLEGLLRLRLCPPVRDALRDVLVTCERSLRTLEVHMHDYGERVFMSARCI
jgi:hypothetical protein